MTKSLTRALSSMLAVLCLFVAGFSCGEDIIRSITITPEDGAADQALDVTVTVVFSNTVSDLVNWEGYFALKKDNAGDNLCTGYNFGGDSRTLQCLHDVLEPDTSYTIIVSHPQASGGASTFTTISG